MMRFVSTITILIAGALLQCAAPAAAQGAPDWRGPRGGDRVAVSGNRLTRNGIPWVPHGIGLVAFEAGPRVRSQHPTFDAAFQHYEPSEFVRIREWGVDSVRIQVAQPAVDPKNQQFRPQFRATIIDAVRAARAAGLVAIVSMQDEPQSGEQRQDPTFLPDPSTISAWQHLAPEFNSDEGILYEVFNEPHIPASAGEDPSRPTADHWRQWSNAMQNVIRAIRATGSKNVIVVDGLEAAQTLSGAPVFPTSFGPIAYAVHPYFQERVQNDPAGWNSRFGYFSQSEPVVVTEWNTVVGLTCNAQTPALALQFLRYTHMKGIGIEPYAYDFVQPGFGAIVSAFATWRPNPPTTFVKQRCAPNAARVPQGTPDFGAGKTVQTWYRTGVVPSTPQ